MGWRLKSTQSKLLSALPGGSWFYRNFRESATRRTVVSRTRTNHKIGVDLGFWHWLQNAHCTLQLTAGRLLGYGSGWHPTISLLWYALGNNQQTLAGITPNIDVAKVNDAIRIFREIASEPAWPGRSWLKRLPETKPVTDSRAGAVLAHLGIK